MIVNSSGRYLSRTVHDHEQEGMRESRLSSWHCAITGTLERIPDVRRDFRQRGVVPGGKIQVLRRPVHDLMGSERVPSGQ
jgi:hypothetical protein